GASADGFELFYDLHRPDLWRASDAPAGEGGAEQIDERDVRPQQAFDRRDAVIEGGVLLDRPRLRHLHTPDLADTADIVPLQVDDHVQLGLILDALAQRFLHVRQERTRSLDRAADDFSQAGRRIEVDRQAQ